MNNIRTKILLMGMKISEEGHETRGQYPLFNQDGKMNVEKIATNCGKLMTKIALTRTPSGGIFARRHQEYK